MATSVGNSHGIHCMRAPCNVRDMSEKVLCIFCDAELGPDTKPEHDGPIVHCPAPLHQTHFGSAVSSRSKPLAMFDSLVPLTAMWIVASALVPPRLPLLQ